MHQNPDLPSKELARIQPAERVAIGHLLTDQTLSKLIALGED